MHGLIADSTHDQTFQLLEVQLNVVESESILTCTGETYLSEIRKSKRVLVTFSVIGLPMEIFSIFTWTQMPWMSFFNMLPGLYFQILLLFYLLDEGSNGETRYFIKYTNFLEGLGNFAVEKTADLFIIVLGLIFIPLIIYGVFSGTAALLAAPPSLGLVLIIYFLFIRE